MASDYTVIGTVLAIAVAIILLAGLALYVAFRVRETLHDEKGGAARAAKVGFLIGLLFLSGGVFFFFASGFNPGGGGGNATNTTTGTLSNTLSTSTTGTSTISSTSSAYSGSTTESQTQTVSSTVILTTQSSTSSTTTGPVNMQTPSCPSRVNASRSFSCTLLISNNSGGAYSGTAVYSGGDFASFTVLSCTESVNGGSSTTVPVSSQEIELGNLAYGNTFLTFTVQAPSTAGSYSNSMLTLSGPGLSAITVTFSIQVNR